MPRQKINSPAFESWVSAFLGTPFQNEGCYDEAVHAAELLEYRREITSSELVEMVRRANVLLACLPSHDQDL